MKSVRLFFFYSTGILYQIYFRLFSPFSGHLSAHLFFADFLYYCWFSELKKNIYNYIYYTEDVFEIEAKTRDNQTLILISAMERYFNKL